MVCQAQLMENNFMLCCNDTVLHQCPRARGCPEEIVHKFSENATQQLWRVDALLLVNAILAGVIVGIGAYGHRYRHYGFSRYLLLGATTLFLPIISYILSAFGSTGSTISIHELIANCSPSVPHQYLIMVSTALVLISAINTSSIVATDDREHRSIRPPFELLLQGIWILYLLVSTIYLDWDYPSFYILVTPFALMHTKMALKYYAFLKAQKSFALGRNPRLIVGYMQQLREGSDQHVESMMASEEDVNVPPPLIVMGEDERQVEKQPHGYMFKKIPEGVQADGGLVTIDRVWLLENMFLNQMQPRLKDICLSFALFKLLRCRFARYKLNNVTSLEAINFIRNFMIKEGEYERAFRVIADELSFLHDYYDSPLPISYSDSWLTISSMIISVLTIGYCTLSAISGAYILARVVDGSLVPPTVQCFYYCRRLGPLSSDEESKLFGNLYFDVVPAALLLVFVVVAEARDISSHICSSWTKVILTCRCVRRASLGLSPVVPRWVGCLLRCRCDRLMRHWNDKMRQNSLLVLHHRQFHQLVCPGSLSRLLDRKKNNNVKVPSAVKVCIINALRSTSNGASLSKGITSLHQSPAGESLLWACNNSKGTTDTILVWHIATTILEVRYPHHQHDDKKTAATHLSRYCAYLVEFCPELLPDDDAWSKGLYKDVKKDAERALAVGGGTAVSSMPPEPGYRRLIELLGMRQNHEVLKDAAKLADQLGELATGGEETAWKLLAGFWSEMVLYLAPSDNLKGHMEAVDRGGELITLLWTLLTHVGIVDRPESASAAGASSS
uniref:Uncharacterized protein n=1 Tax=Avena sativa TaxID=4498 RepID=A0ACD5YUF6_AVESA